MTNVSYLLKITAIAFSQSNTKTLNAPLQSTTITWNYFVNYKIPLQFWTVTHSYWCLTYTPMNNSTLSRIKDVLFWNLRLMLVKTGKQFNFTISIEWKPYMSLGKNLGGRVAFNENFKGGGGGGDTLSPHPLPKLMYDENVNEFRRWKFYFFSYSGHI